MLHKREILLHGWNILLIACTFLSPRTCVKGNPLRWCCFFAWHLLSPYAISIHHRKPTPTFIPPFLTLARIPYREVPVLKIGIPVLLFRRTVSSTSCPSRWCMRLFYGWYDAPFLHRFKRMDSRGRFPPGILFFLFCIKNFSGWY